MAFSRTKFTLVHAPELDRAMRNIGLRIGAASWQGPPADIEVTLASVVREALPTDYRLLAVLLAWLDRHHGRVNVPRLGRVLSEVDSTSTERALWAAIGHWLGRSDSRWDALTKLYKGPRVDLGDPLSTELAIRRHGEDPRFVDAPVRVDAKILRSRPSDVYTEAQVAERHPVYRARLLHGPTHRADVWAALDQDPERSVAEVAHAVGCAYASAHQVAADWRLARACGVA
jgi:hypothetical protein